MELSAAMIRLGRFDEYGNQIDGFNEMNYPNPWISARGGNDLARCISDTIRWHDTWHSTYHARYHVDNHITIQLYPRPRTITT